MLKLKGIRGRGLAAGLAVAVLAALLALSGQAQRTSEAAVDGPGNMALVVKSAGTLGTCASDAQPASPSELKEKCVLQKGSQFTLSVVLEDKPQPGYQGFQTLITWTGQPTKDQLNYLPAPSAFDEVVWPDGVIAHRQTGLKGPNSVSHADFSAPVPPLPVSTHKGALVELTFECKPGPDTENIRFDLVPYDDPGQVFGSGLYLPPTTTVTAVPPVSLKIMCVQPKLPDPGDTDGDGCSDERESQPKSEAQMGGGRNYLNPHDYFDVNGDQYIDLPNDILGVMVRYTADPRQPYDPAYDRGPLKPGGTNPWNRSGPDGVIDLPNDILSVLFQWQHDCRP